MNTLVVYYSLDGNTRFIGQAIAKSLGADMLELKLRKEIKSRGFMKYLWGGKQVFMKEAPELETYPMDPAIYDLFFIGTPVWAQDYAPPLRTFFSSVKLEHKKIALFCCHAGSKGKTFKKMEAQMAGNEILDRIDFLEPLKHNCEASGNQVKLWARNIVSNIIRKNR